MSRTPTERLVLTVEESQSLRLLQMNEILVGLERTFEQDELNAAEIADQITAARRLLEDFCRVFNTKQRSSR